MSRERILITGADGNLGGCLVKELTENTDYDVVAVSLSRDWIEAMLERERIADRDRVLPFEQEAFFHTDWNALNVSAAVHMAFARGNRPSHEIAGSLDYARDAFRRLHEMRVPRVVYTSSQSVYGALPDWRREDCPPAPESLYAMAKYAGEKMLETQFRDATGISYTTVRLDYVIQSQKLVSALCWDAKTTGAIHLKGGRQTFSYIDRSDVARAIVALLKYKGPWQPVYNVGHHRMRYTLPEVAEIVARVAKKHGIDNVAIQLEANDTELWSGMDTSRFMTDTGWKPSMDMERMVESIYEKV